MDTLNLMTEVQLAYLAGLLDGEGCITVCQRGRKLKSGTPQHEALVAVGMVDPTAILWALNATGLGRIRRHDNTKYNPKWSMAYTWRVSTRDAARLLERVLPYLQLKKRQAELVIEITALKRLSTNKVQHAPERQAAIIEEMRGLNRRGRAA